MRFDGSRFASLVDENSLARFGTKRQGCTFQLKGVGDWGLLHDRKVSCRSCTPRCRAFHWETHDDGNQRKG